ncbi:MAG: CBS domain-containing protein [Alphaproteobacteria bacterium]
MTKSGIVDNYMSTELVTFAPDFDLHHAIKLLLARGISGAPVVDDTGRLVGILTKRDCLKLAFSASYHKEWAGKVSEYMTRDVEAVEAGTDIVEVAELFLTKPFHRFPVMQNDRLVGVITRHDILQALDKLW